jgi:hypothetical protein
VGVVLCHLATAQLHSDFATRSFSSSSLHSATAQDRLLPAATLSTLRHHHIRAPDSVVRKFILTNFIQKSV